MLNYGVYDSSTGTSKVSAKTKSVGGKRVPVKAVIGPMGDKSTSSSGKEGEKTYRPPAYQFLDFLDGSSRLMYASSAAIIALATNTLY